jgi:cell wall-associated NlpC family hydrolase
MGRRRPRALVVKATAAGAAVLLGVAALASSRAADASSLPARSATTTTRPARTSPPVAVTTDAVAVAASDALAALWVQDAEAFEQDLDTLVPLVATRIKVKPAALRTAWTGVDRRRMIAMLAALTEVGVPYKRNARAEGVAFDCSGLTSWAWSVAGITISKARVKQITQLLPSSEAAVLPGDVFSYPGHVMLAVGVGEAMIDAPGTGRFVQVRTMYRARLHRVDVLAPKLPYA